MPLHVFNVIDIIGLTIMVVMVDATSPLVEAIFPNVPTYIYMKIK